MSAQHTLAPWVVSNNAVFGNHGVIKPLVADLNLSPVNDDESKANARLIAAAPDLLAALQALVGEADLGELDHDDDARALLDNARAAIERATGVPA